MAWAKGCRYLTKTLEETYAMYKEHCFKKNSKKSVAFSTFCKMRPVKIYKIAQTPDRQCICDTSENFRLLHQAMKVNLIKGIEQHTDLCIKQSLCTVNPNESNKSSNSASEEIDGCHQVDPSYGYFSCISCNCKHCGPEVILMKILEENPDLLTSTVPVSWSRWEWVEKKGSKSKRLESVHHPGTKKELIDQYIADLDGMSLHLFTCNWNYSQFVNVHDMLKPGQLLQVLDFSQNYLNVYQDKAQGAHWDHTQTVIHPIVNYYIGTDGHLVTEEHIMISDDLKHDKYAVKAFEEASLKHHKEKGFVPDMIIQFCDNCVGQYKLKGPFQFISEAKIPTIHMFFGACHGKGPW